MGCLLRAPRAWIHTDGDAIGAAEAPPAERNFSRTDRAASEQNCSLEFAEASHEPWNDLGHLSLSR